MLYEAKWISKYFECMYSGYIMECTVLVNNFYATKKKRENVCWGKKSALFITTC